MDIADLLVRMAVWSVQAVGIVWLVTAAWFAAVRRDSLGGKLRHFLSTLLPEPWMIVGIVVLLVAIHQLPQSIWNHVSWQNAAVQSIGAIIVIAGAALMIWARLALGAMWAGRPMIQQEHRLHTGGPYRFARHPIYTGILGVMFGLILIDGFGASVIVFAFVLAWLLHRVRVEDDMLIATFGDDYRDYRERVRALVPLPR
ncbi:methyltransferase family protein [Nocardia sp. NBC_00511]|uniref:methyltransferase family protein n=1 Tax=Nocardia sp. NBC_00511 TaxID=2903591 RepID=UPI0030E3A96D